jgi:hypothetical protein
MGIEVLVFVFLSTNILVQNVGMQVEGRGYYHGPHKASYNMGLKIIWRKSWHVLGAG